MTTLREAAQQALAWAENHGEIGFAGGGWKAVGGMNAWTQALRAALEQPEQEPVAWMVYTEDGKSAYVTDNPHDLVGAYKAFAIYTAPPQHKN